MSTELKLLMLSIVLGFVHILASAHSANFQRGYRWAAGPRDEARPPLTGLAGRLDRALGNFLETFPFFAAAVLIAQAVGKQNILTLWGAHLYVWGRFAFLPLYAFGVSHLRSLAWNVATVGIFLILLGTL